MRDKNYEKAIKFLEENYIDTDYYLTDEAVGLIGEGVLHLENIDKMSAPDMAYWLDLDKLILDENL